MFGTFLRKKAIETILASPELERFHRIMQAELYPHNQIYIRDKNHQLQPAPWSYKEGGAQGSFTSQLGACAVIQPYLKIADAQLKVVNGYGRGGIDDITFAGPPDLVYRVVREFQENCEKHCGLKVNYNSTMVYHPQGDYRQKPEQYQIGTKVIRTTNNSLGGTEESEVKVEGVTIWGAAISNDERYIEAHINSQIDKIKSDINKVIPTLNLVSPDCAMSALKLSFYHRFNYYAQTHLPHQCKEAATTLQKLLDQSLTLIAGVDLSDPNTYKEEHNDTISNPDIIIRTLSLPTEYKGAGLRSQLDILEPAFLGAINQCASMFIDVTTPEGHIIEGLYQHLEPIFGPHSQDRDQQRNRFTQFTNGSSEIGNIVKLSWLKLQNLVKEEERVGGPLEQPPSSIGTNGFEQKLQNSVSKQIEKSKSKAIEEEYKSLPNSDRRKQCYFSRRSETLTFMTTTPTKTSEVPKDQYQLATCLTLGAIHPLIRKNVGKKVGQHSRLDHHGDVLGTVHLQGDRWRTFHDKFKNIVYKDGKSLGIQISMEPYGLFSPYISERARTAFSRMNNVEKRKQLIIPDLLTNINNVRQMMEIKVVHAFNSFSRLGFNKGLNDYYKNFTTVSGVEKRQQKIPQEYLKKAQKGDKELGDPGSTRIEDALKAMKPVKGLVIGAIGELSTNIQSLVNQFATEGSMNRPEMFGTDNPLRAKGIISWYLKKRWSRLAVTAAVACRLEAMSYVGEKAQQEADRRHRINETNKNNTQDEEQDQWAYDRERENRDNRHTN
jgi:hypothetical protein